MSKNKASTTFEVGKTYKWKPTKRNYQREDVPTSLTVTDVRYRKNEVNCLVGFKAIDGIVDTRFPIFLYYVEELGNEIIQEDS